MDTHRQTTVVERAPKGRGLSGWADLLLTYRARQETAMALAMSPRETARTLGCGMTPVTSGLHDMVDVPEGAPYLSHGGDDRVWTRCSRCGMSDSRLA